jgi:hypothetical protein
MSARARPTAPLALPMAVRLNVSSLSTGEALFEATALDTSQTVVARGTSTASLPLSSAIVVELRCEGMFCSKPGADGGADTGTGAGEDAGIEAGGVTPDGPDADPDARSGEILKCGNGDLDPGETCDIARAPDLLGACPTSCDDGIACTRDERVGDRCQAACRHSEITKAMPGDGCCPARADARTDPDCALTCGNGRVDPGEACDLGIVGGPGACPDEAACVDQDPCTTDLLISEGTCSARCLHEPILLAVDGDGCCPLAANASTDADCPASCGNGVREPGEACDTAITAGDDVCPTLASCDDQMPCTLDRVAGSGCQARCTHTPIDSPASGDGCCPIAGLSRNIDSDCPPTCGNSILEAGEACDKGLGPSQPGACPTVCGPPPAACTRLVMRGSPTNCTAACVPVAVTSCSPISDGCCPTRCTAANDPDCSATCGNGQVETGETCDTAIASGAGACPRSCADGVSCTDDLLIDAATCSAHCVFVATTTLRNGDGCCPPGAHAGVDSDCPATCGNGVVELPWETCDTASVPLSCATDCPPPGTCSTWKRTATTGCDVRCTPEPITACANQDGCCPTGCDASNDSDCLPRCGDGLVEPPETCDRSITAGHAGACPSSCADNDPCTLDFARGTPGSCTRACSHVLITACGGGDRCCPAGCSAETDSDCAPVCGDGQLQGQETCDPISTCPTSCPSDGDPCTVDQLVGSAATCSAACAHVPILRCSGTQKDGCCPTQCNAISDSDC